MIRYNTPYTIDAGGVPVKTTWELLVMLQDMAMSQIADVELFVDGAQIGLFDLVEAIDTDNIWISEDDGTEHICGLTDIVQIRVNFR